MTEDEAVAWLQSELDVSRETLEKLDAFRRLVLSENGHQNLISTDSADHIWARHIVDSAQLLLLTRPGPASWLDLGTGAGFPGMVIAILSEASLTFVEFRKRRAEFLQNAVRDLGLTNVDIHNSRLEMLNDGKFDVLCARAFAPLAKTFQLAHRFADKKTVWLLPKGRSVQSELESLRGSWHGVFHVKQSATDAEAGIIVATGVRPLGAA